MVVKAFLLSLPFAVASSIALLTVGSVVAGATTGTAQATLGAWASALAVGISGPYVGLVARRRCRLKRAGLDRSGRGSD
ncbi:hypothetical protein [Frondihabitans cladoniiphilus]|uniref:Uncharacterized protein n=1 Tax=Frondihabitans cladoniiphilus TaxID=715785 RepID=A0ABP8VUV6_9MICO